MQRGALMKLPLVRIDVKPGQIVMINFGLFLVAAGIVFFKIPNNFVTGGVSGISIIAARLLPGISVGPAMTGINALLIVLGFAFLGSSFGWKTIYASFALSGMVWILEALVPLHAPLTGDPLLELVYSVVLPGIGSAIVFNNNASTGGTDILAKILNRKTNVNIGITLLASDFCIAAGSVFVFGIECALYSVLGLAMKAVVVDMAIESMNVHKKMEIVTTEPALVRGFILDTVHRGATMYTAQGAFSGHGLTVIHTVVSRREAFKIRSFIKIIDPQAFITITNASQIIGKGFRSGDT